MRAMVLVALWACGYSPDRVAASGDAADDARADAAIDAPGVLGPWSAPVEILEVNSTVGDDDPSLTDDLLEIFFCSTRNGTDEDIFVATRASADQPFGTPQPVVELNSIFTDTTARVSRDGLSIMFASLRETADFELFFATRNSRSAAWGVPQRVVELGSTSSDFSAFMSSDRRTVVFASSRDGTEDLFQSKRANGLGPWETPTKMLDLSTGFAEYDPVTVDADTIYFASDRDGTVDIFVANRVGGTFVITPVSEFNTAFDERDIWVSSDQRTAVFSSTRNGTDDIFISTRSFQ